MARALELAERGRGRTAPNPCVGAVLVRAGQVVAEGWHTACGKPHAEVEALADAARKGVDPAGCDLYVTLEPCNHQGKTPPCSRAILAAGIRRVFVGCADANAVAAGGAEFLRSQGVEVRMGGPELLEERCAEAIADFRVLQTLARPYVVLKLAQTLDGKIAAAPGSDGCAKVPCPPPEAVSGPESHARVQQLRAVCDAVMVGGGTLRADNPRLTCRLPAGHSRGTGVQPLAVVVTRRLPRADSDYVLLAERAAETVFLTTGAAAASPLAQELRGLGCRVWDLPTSGEVLELEPGLARLRAELGVQRLLCEGGGLLAMKLLDQRLADEVRIFLAPKVLGDGAAIPGFHGLHCPSMAQARRLRFVDCKASGQDLELTLRPLPGQDRPTKESTCSPA